MIKSQLSDSKSYVISGYARSVNSGGWQEFSVIRTGQELNTSIKELERRFPQLNLLDELTAAIAIIATEAQSGLNK